VEGEMKANSKILERKDRRKTKKRRRTERKKEGGGERKRYEGLEE
jgi:hypothetical protein